MALNQQDLEKYFKKWNAGNEKEREMMNKSNQPAPTYRQVPTLEEVSRKQSADGGSISKEKRQALSRKQLAQGTDSASMSLKKAEQQKQMNDLNNISKTTGTTNVQNYAKKFNYDDSYAKKNREDIEKMTSRAEELTSMPARTIAEDNELESIRETVDNYNKLHETAKKNAEKTKNAMSIENPILDAETKAQMDVEARTIQKKIANGTATYDDEKRLQELYDASEASDKAEEKQKILNGENHLVDNKRYNKLMSDGRFADDIDKLVDVIYNNANQDATVSSEWADTYGAKAITGLTKDNYIDQLSKRYELTPAELKDIALTRKTEKNDEEIAQFRSDMNALGAQHPVAGSIGSFAGTIGNAFEAPYNVAVNAITGDDRYTSRMFNTEKEGLREGVKSNINSELGDTLYDIGMGVGDMGVGALMGSAPYVLAGNTTNRTMLDALDRGVDPRHAALYSGATGLTDYITNKIGLDYAKELAMEGITASGLKGALARNAVAGLGEGGENLLQDTAQALLDKVINGEDSELSQAYNQLVAQGYSEEDAFREVAKQFAKQEAISFGQGVAMGSAMNAGVGAVNAVKNLPELEKPNLGNLYDVERTFTDEDVNNRVRPENVNIDGRDYVLDKGNNTLTDADGKVIPLIDTSVFDTSKRGTKEQSKREFAEELTKFIKDNYIGKSFEVSQNGQEIQFLDRSAKEFAGSLSSMRKPNDQMGLKANLAPRFRSIIENAIFNHNEPNMKAYSPIKARGMDKFDITVAYPTTNGIEIYDAVMDVGLHENGNDYFYDILNIEPKKKATPPPSPNGVGTNLGQPISTNSVSQNGGVVNRSYKDLLPENPFYETDSYKQLESERAEIENQISDLEATRKELYNRLDNETISKKAKEEMTPDEYITSMFFLEPKPTNYTEEGNRIKESIRGVNEQIDNLNNRHREILDTEKEIKNGTRVEQLQNYQFAEPQPATQNEYEGFDITKATNTGMQEALDSGKATIVEMSPLEYLRRSTYDIEDEATLESVIETANGINKVHDYADAMRNGDKFPILDLTYEGKSGRGQEGRTRALAAYEAGIDKVPVAIVGKPSENPNNARFISDYEFNKRLSENPLTDEEVDNALMNMPEEELQKEAGISKSDELPWTTPDDSPKNSSVDLNLQFFAKKKAQLESQLNDPNLSDADRARIRSELAEVDELIANMDEKFYKNNPTQGEQKISKTVSNADMRMDAERAAEELSKDIGKYFVQTEEMSYSKGRDKVVNDYEGSLNKYMNNEGSMYDGSDYDAIRILEQDIKAKRKQAEADGDTELAQRYRDQLDKLAITRRLRSTTSGEFNQAAAKWIRTAEGAIDVANNLADKALDMMENGNETQQSEAKFIKKTAEDIEAYANKILSSEDIWAELEDADRRLKFENELYQKIKSLGKENGIEVKDELAKKLAKDVMNGQKDAEALARSIATFREYNFLGFDEEFLDKVEAIFDEAEQYDYNSKQRVQLEDKAFEMLAKEIYKKGGDFQEKFDAWRYFAMLANTKTHERNILGNLAFADVIDSSANGIAAIGEGVTDSAVKTVQRLAKKEQTGIKRTKAFLNPASEADQALIASSWKDAEQGSYRDLVGHKYQTDVGNAIEQHKPAFSTTNAVGRGANKTLEANDTALGAEDFFFKRQKYTGQLAAYLKANGEDASIFEVDGKIKDLMKKKSINGLTDVQKAELSQLQKRAKVLEKARKYAIDKAEYATFNKRNETAGILSKHSKEWRESKNPVARFIGREIESLAAFKNTPANILKAMWDYSPVSLARGAGKTVQAIASKDATRHTKIGSAEVNEALELLSKGLVGTGIMALGAKLYKDGILTSSKDEKRGKFDETEGKQSYALNINGASYAIDSLAPAATALFIGAEAYKIWEEHHGEGEDDKFFSKDGIFNADAVNDIVNGSLAVADPVIDQSMLQGAASTLENIRYAQTPGEALMAAVVTPQIGYFAQALPTLGGQIARTADNTRRSLRTNSEGVAGAIERAGRQALNKLPVLNKLNNPYVDMFGRQQENYDGNVLQRLGYQTLAPFFKQDINVEPYQAELDRLYNLDPENYADVLGEAFPNKIDGQRLTNEEWTRGQTVAGEARTSLMNSALESEAYKALSPDEQYEVQKSLQNLAEKIGTKEVRPDKKINNDLLSAYTGDNYGEIVDMAIEDAQGKVRNAKIKESGLPVNDTTKALFDADDQEGIAKYTDEMKIAKEYGLDTISKEQSQIYEVKGEQAFRKELGYAKRAKELGVPVSEDFKKAVDTKSEQRYAEAYKTITSIVTGKDELKNDIHLQYNNTTRAAYDHGGKSTLNQLVKVQKSLPDGLSGSGDGDVISVLNNSSMSNKDKAFFFGLHKGKTSLAKKAPQPTNGDFTETYIWYLLKNYYDVDSSGYITKEENNALHRDMGRYLSSLGYSNNQIQTAQTWDWSSR